MRSLRIDIRRRCRYYLQQSEYLRNIREARGISRRDIHDANIAKVCTRQESHAPYSSLSFGFQRKLFDQVNERYGDTTTYECGAHRAEKSVSLIVRKRRKLFANVAESFFFFRVFAMTHI